MSEEEDKADAARWRYVRDHMVLVTGRGWKFWEKYYRGDTPEIAIDDLIERRIGDN